MKIVRDHGPEECFELILKKKHPRGDCQRLIGMCKHPSEMDYVEYHGAWYTSEGAEKARQGADRLATARAARGKHA